MDMENQNETNAPEKPHKRRIRYSGTHPKTYKEKYKEHQPEKYVDMIEHVIEKGGTPAVCTSRSALKKLLIFFRFSGTEGAGCHLRLWRSLQSHAGMSEG